MVLRHQVDIATFFFIRDLNVCSVGNEWYFANPKVIIGNSEH